MKKNKQTKIDFGYAFSEPHRICVCLPNSSNKTLYDCTKDSLSMLWSDSDTTHNPLGAYKRVRLDWKVKIIAKCNDVAMEAFSWERIEGYIPSLLYKAKAEGANLTVQCVATRLGDVIKMSVTNTTGSDKNIFIDACVLDNTINTKWADFDCEYSVVNPIFNDASDRIVIMDASLTDTVPSRRESVTYAYTLKAKETRESMLIRPNKKYNDDIEVMLKTNWNALYEQGLNEWRNIIKKAPVFDLPDPMIENAYKACLCDIFVMREEMADGRMAGLAGTEMYRSSNTGEPCFQALTLGKYGFFEPAKENIEFVASFQLNNGSWEDDKQWGKYMWASSGWKSRCIQHYYLRTKDRAFLEENFERMLASARWSKAQREKTKKKNSPDSPEWGLMPRGMGDGGLKNGDDLFGVFYPHNFMHCMGLEAAVWAAKELQREDVYDELLATYLDHKECILKSLQIGHIKEPDGSVWIGSCAHNTSGSRWAVADAVYPTNILPVDHPLAVGTMNKLQGNISEGGLPKNLGWIHDGLWVAIALDAMAYVNILADKADISADYLVAALNHGTPLFTWCEERTEEKGAKRITGDLQHAWTPICVAQFIRDMLVSDYLFKDDMLHLTCAVPRYFYKEGNAMNIKEAPAFQGKISFSIEVSKNTVTFTADLCSFDINRELCLHLRLPNRNLEVTVQSISGGSAVITEQKAVIKPDTNKIKAVFNIG
ncbi:MAG TPA: hypothetical protein GXZ71_00695 [Clostridiaceae bacterium]|jgi:hypothetical protein|nr:hypothetical protein [Clostridiaceae bacterium]